MKLSVLELAALRDISTYPGNYTWKESSMRKLSEKGLVYDTGRLHYQRKVWKMTDAGRAALVAIDTE
jgi:hypothetical protein